jgi:hypothetical protein
MVGDAAHYKHEDLAAPEFQPDGVRRNDRAIIVQLPTRQSSQSTPVKLSRL